MFPLRQRLAPQLLGRCISSTAVVRVEAARVEFSDDEPERCAAPPRVPETPVRKTETLTTAQQNAQLPILDPFESLPLRRVATYLGETFAPKLENIKETELRRSKAVKYTEVTEPPPIPHFLPLTRWASQSEKVRQTLIVDEGRRQKVRLSWYHPDDTMVPRGWFSKGLLEDLKYYKPFGRV